MKELEKRFAYRLIIVIYFILLFITLSLVVVLSWEGRPVKVKDYENFRIICDNGSKIRPGAWVFVKGDGNLYSDDDKNARSYCFNGKPYTENEPSVVPSSKNYSLELPDKIV